MKKNYFQPEMKVNKILLTNMIALSEGAISEEGQKEPFGTKDNLLDDWEGLY